MIFLDTNFLIHLLNPNSKEAILVEEWFNAGETVAEKSAELFNLAGRRRGSMADCIDLPPRRSVAGDAKSGRFSSV